MKTFRKTQVYAEGKGIVRTDVAFDTHIRSLENSAGDAIDLPGNAMVLPAFIDQHVHGAGGADTMDGTVAALSVMADALAKEGTARFLATTMTQSDQNTRRALRAVKAYRESERAEGAGLLGVHLEGPFISPKHIGAQPAEYVILPDTALFDAWQNESGNAVRLVTLAPEQEGALALIRHIVQCGVRVSAGHTDADYEQICAAVQQGATCVTHTYNAQKGLHHREIGTVGAALYCNDLYTELIADTVHVSVPAMQLLYKNKPRGKVILITDAIRAKGAGEGESELGGQPVFVRGGEARLLNGALAGSVLAMNVAVRNMIEKTGVPLCEAVDCATADPAKHLGVFNEYGSIREGKRADFAVVDEHMRVIMTVRDGEIVYKA